MKLKLNKRIEIFLFQHEGIFSYGELARIFNTAPIGVGNAMRAIGKRNMEITNRVVYSNELR